MLIFRFGKFLFTISFLSVSSAKEFWTYLYAFFLSVEIIWFLFFVIYSIDKLYYTHWSAEVKTISYSWNKSDLATVYNSI